MIESESWEGFQHINFDEHRINKYITLKLKGSRTEIYLCGERFTNCKYLLINIPVEKVKDFDDFEYMDQVIKAHKGGGESHCTITPEQSFIGHCSNLETWVENDYDLRILDTKLSLPILQRILEKEKDKTELRNIMIKLIPSLEDYIQKFIGTESEFTAHWSNIRGLFLDKFNSLVVPIFGKNPIFTQEEIEGSPFLTQLYHRLQPKWEKILETRKRNKFLNSLNYHERKIWGSGEAELEHRRFLRRIRDLDQNLLNTSTAYKKKNMDLLVSDEEYYLPYLYSKGKFVDAGAISFYHVGSKTYIRHENGLEVLKPTPKWW